MDDRQLLELAAKAAGLTIIYHSQEARDAAGHGSAGLYVRWSGGGISTCWNPLTDDGDVLRLAVSLKIDIHQRVTEPRVAAVAAMQKPIIESCDESTRLVATRRAIVRAAAEIGRSMP